MKTVNGKVVKDGKQQPQYYCLPDAAERLIQLQASGVEWYDNESGTPREIAKRAFDFYVSHGLIVPVTVQ